MSGYRLGNLNLRVVLGKKTLNMDNSKNMRGPGDNIRNKGAETWSPLKGSNTYSPNKGSDLWGPNQRPAPGPGGTVPGGSQGASSAEAFSSRTDIVNGNQVIFETVYRDLNPRLLVNTKQGSSLANSDPSLKGSYLRQFVPYLPIMNPAIDKIRKIILSPAIVFKKMTCDANFYPTS